MVDYYGPSNSSKILLTTDYPEIYAQPILSAKQAGLQSGDIIISIEGEPIEYFHRLVK